MWTTEQQRWIRVEEKAVDRTLDGLERALALNADNPAWMAGMERALAELEEALSKHLAATAVCDGVLCADDLDGPMMPRLARKMKKLREQVGLFVQQVRELRQQIASPDASAANIRALLLALRKLRGEEAGLILEDVTTDVGAGD
jgi:hypothetical protein